MGWENKAPTPDAPPAEGTALLCPDLQQGVPEVRGAHSAVQGGGQAGHTYLPRHPPSLPVGLRVFHSLADLLHQLIQLHRRFDQDRAELLTDVLRTGN